MNVKKNDTGCSRGDELAVRHGKMQSEIVKFVPFTSYDRLATLHSVGKRFRDALWKT
jgi:hypothetical protein